MKMNSTSRHDAECGMEEQFSALEDAASQYFQAGDFSRALASQQKAMRLHMMRGNRSREADCAQAVGFLHFLLQDHADAIAAYEQAIELRAGMGDGEGEAVALAKLAEVYQHIANHEKALVVLERSLGLCKKAGDHKSVGTVLNNLGMSYREIGKREDAARHFRQALVIRLEQDDTEGLAATLHNLGALYAESDDGLQDEARSLLEEASRLRQVLGDKRGLGRTELCLGQLYQHMNDMHAAVACYEQAWRLATDPEVNDPDDEAAALHNLGSAAILMGDPERALRMLEQAKHILIASGMATGIAITFYNLGIVHAALGRTASAMRYLWDAKTLQERSGDSSGLGATLVAIGTIFSDTGEQVLAYDHLSRARKLQEELGERQVQACVLDSLAKVCIAQGKPEEAASHLKSAASLLGGNAHMLRTTPDAVFCMDDNFSRNLFPHSSDDEHVMPETVALLERIFRRDARE